MKRYGLVLPGLLVLLLTTACAAPAVALQPESQAETGGASTGVTVAGTSSETVDVVAGDGDATTSAPAAASSYTLQPGMSPRSTRGHVWAEPLIDGDSVTIPLGVASMDDHLHFEVPDGDSNDRFVAYFVEGQFVVRADYCPACGSERIEWGGSRVVCRSCDAKFDAVTGEGDGEDGFPAGAVPYTIGDDSITLSLAELATAHVRTVDGEATLFEEPIVVEDDDDGDTSWPRCCTR